MAGSATTAALGHRDLFAAARSGDHDAYRRLIEPHRELLRAHCYRMLGSVHDGEDALQDALLRAWRFLPSFGGRSSLRAWLYRIATNACLDLLARRSMRALPVDRTRASDPHLGVGEPLAESVWIEPYPAGDLDDVRVAPEARYELRESVELAFVAALQHLPPLQRAALIMREVLAFSAKEVADALDTTVPAVNSALQRARRTVDQRLPERTQQQTLRALGDARLEEIVSAYMDAMAQGDVERVVALLAEDIAWSMPPLAGWFRGRDDVRVFLENGPLSGRFRWRHLPLRVNGQAAVGTYSWHGAQEAFVPFALDVLTLRGDRIAEVTAFVARTPVHDDRAALADWPNTPASAVKTAALFNAHGLPDHLD